MKKILVLLIMMIGLLAGCGEKEVSYSEVKLERVNANVQDFIQNIQTSQEPDTNGIYKFNYREKESYLYVDQNFLDSGKGFGGLTITTDEDSLNLNLREDDEPTEDEYKLYKIKLDRTYEYVRIFKNDEDTYFQVIGTNGY